MITLYVSTDDNSLYLEKDLDLPIDPDYFWRIELPETVTLTAAQLCGAYGNITEILLRAKIARKL